jgi:uncharacterized metal-binding protein YceD (DUF177 family)
MQVLCACQKLENAMNQLLIPAAAVGDEGLPLDVMVEIPEVQPLDTPGVPLKVVHVQGLVLAVDNDYLFQGKLKGVYERACDRCLAEACVAWELEIGWFFEEGPGGVYSPKTLDDDTDDMIEAPVEHRPQQSGTMDLGPCVWEEVVLNVPPKFLCKPDCRGLCPRCGANLNDTPCMCGSGETGDEAPANGLADLARLFPDLAPKKSEE